jgi:hypothetical protein
MDIRIFQLVISDRSSRAALEITGGRISDLEAPYYLKFGEQFTLRLSLDQARRFASSVRRLAFRQRNAATDEKEALGPVYKRQVGADGAAWKVELGIAEGNCIYVEAGSVKITCDEQQRDDALYFFECFAADVTAISTMSEPPRPYAPGHDSVLKWMRHWN